METKFDCSLVHTETNMRGAIPTTTDNSFDDFDDFDSCPVAIKDPQTNHDIIIHDANLSIRRAMLTTSDNPFDPFDDFDSWFAFDTSQNYNSCSYLARIAKTSDELSDVDNELAIEQAIDEIINLNLTGNYLKVVRGFEVNKKNPDNVH